MITSLQISDFLYRSTHSLTLDVRSEGEYHYGHIPHAVNLPLFTNDERQVIGTIYKQQSRNEALLKGLDLVGNKMSSFVRFVQPLVTDNKIFIHCWRGGMRSASMAWLFDQFGYEVYTLAGGYKSYRHMVLDALAQPHQYIILGGKTGSGKTAVLHELKQQGEQVIDLEALANHKGSAFGMLGQPPQPSTEHFENLLHHQLSAFNHSKRIWLEDESKKIGTVVLDQHLWNVMKASPLIVLELPQELRIKRLVRDYGDNQQQRLQQSLTTIRKRLGGLDWKQAMVALEQKDYATTARITLNYYDKTYDHSLAQQHSAPVLRMAFDTDDIAHIASTLINRVNEKF